MFGGLTGVSFQFGSRLRMTFFRFGESGGDFFQGVLSRSERRLDRDAVDFEGIDLARNSIALFASLSEFLLKLLHGNRRGFERAFRTRRGE